MAELPSVRHDAILAHLQASQHASVRQLCDLTGASEATIRRDLDELEKKGLLRRTRGGGSSVKAPGPQEEGAVYDRVAESRDTKEAIATAALSLIRDGETVFLGSGSTVLQLARLLGDKKNLTVISNSLPVILELYPRKDLRLIIIGGALRRDELSIIGHLADRAIEELKADRAFLGAEAIHPDHGLTHTYLEETLTDRNILNIASDITVLADHSKFGRVRTSFWAPVTSVHRIISDTGLDPDTAEKLRARGVEVLLVQGETPASGSLEA